MCRGNLAASLWDELAGESPNAWSVKLAHAPIDDVFSHVDGVAGTAGCGVWTASGTLTVTADVDRVYGT